MLSGKKYFSYKKDATMSHEAELINRGRRSETLGTRTHGTRWGARVVGVAASLLPSGSS